mgnify:CR=1 FL=1
MASLPPAPPWLPPPTPQWMLVAPSDSLFGDITSFVEAIGIFSAILSTAILWFVESRRKTRQSRDEALMVRLDTRLALEQQASESNAHRIECQISQLFGPMVGLLHASMAAQTSARFALKQKQILPWQDLYEDEECTIERKDFRWFPDRHYATDQKVEVVKEWRLWVRTAMAPLLEQMVSLVMAHIEHLPGLAPGDDLPAPLRQLLSHQISYKVLLESWEREERANQGEPIGLKSYQNTATVAFPHELEEYVQESWSWLLARRTDNFNEKAKRDSMQAKMTQTLSLFSEKSLKDLQRESTRSLLMSVQDRLQRKFSLFGEATKQAEPKSQERMTMRV